VRLRAAAVGLALAGLAVSGYLTYVQYAELQPFCTGLGDCAKVQSSRWSELGGVPVALIGLIGYALILGALALALRAEVAAFLAYGAVGFSAYFTWIELFEVKALCPWCLTSAVIAVALAVVTTLLALRPDAPPPRPRSRASPARPRRRRDREPERPRSRSGAWPPSGRASG
jgi:uncharacterized membrane protein